MYLRCYDDAAVILTSTCLSHLVTHLFRAMMTRHMSHAPTAVMATVYVVTDVSCAHTNMTTCLWRPCIRRVTNKRVCKAYCVNLCHASRETNAAFGLAKVTFSRHGAGFLLTALCGEALIPFMNRCLLHLQSGPMYLVIRMLPGCP